MAIETGNVQISLICFTCGILLLIFWMYYSKKVIQKHKHNPIYSMHIPSIIKLQKLHVHTTNYLECRRPKFLIIVTFSYSFAVIERSISFYLASSNIISQNVNDIIFYFLALCFLIPVLLARYFYLY